MKGGRGGQLENVSQASKQSRSRASHPRPAPKRSAAGQPGICERQRQRSVDAADFLGMEEGRRRRPGRWRHRRSQCVDFGRPSLCEHLRKRPCCKECSMQTDHSTTLEWSAWRHLRQVQHAVWGSNLKAQPYVRLRNLSHSDEDRKTALLARVAELGGVRELGMPWFLARGCGRESPFDLYL